MNFQTILIFLTLLSGILTDPGDWSQVEDQRRPLTGGDATPSKKRAAPSGGDPTPQRQRLASGNATPSRQRLEEDVPLPRKRPASPGVDPSAPRHRFAGGDTASYRQKGDSGPPRRPPSSGGDASPQRRFSSSAGDASPPKRSLSFEGGANPPRRLSSSEKDANPPRRLSSSEKDASSPRRLSSSGKDAGTPRRLSSSRGDVSSPRSRPSSPTRVETSSRRLSITLEREQSTPRQRPTSSRPTNSVGDEYSLKQRPTNTEKDESLPRPRSINSVRDESFSRQSSTNSAREESLSIEQFLNSMRDESPSKQWSASADGNASPSRRRERVEESKKTSEFPTEPTMSQKKEKLLELGNMREEMEKMQEEIVGMLQDLFWSSNLTGDDMENSLNAKSRETLQAILKDGIQEITAKSHKFIDLVDKTKALIRNAGVPGNSAEAAKNIKSLHKMKTDITAMNENYMRQIEKNLKGMIEMEKSAIGGKAISLGSSSRTTPKLRGHKGTSTSPRGEKKATSMSQPEIPSPQRTGTLKRKNSSRE
ncbi:unnamed protein product [Bemisia tabaci]|uniref:Uncharacterized protein n=1 Tax=Bemisia tabaci TaxID=7038 RepID=A0A9P0ACJ6_BEMTA|nr:unnamed protein product [Bemisia tabaci]